MKIYFSIVFLLFGCISSPNDNEVKRAIIDFSSKELVIDSVNANERKFISFKIYNRGSKQLNIKEMVADCHCSELRLEKQDVNPGDSSRVDVIYKPILLGPAMQKIIIKSNGSDEDEVVVFRAIVK